MLILKEAWSFITLCFLNLLQPLLGILHKIIIKEAVYFHSGAKCFFLHPQLAFVWDENYMFRQLCEAKERNEGYTFSPMSLSS